MLRIIAGIIVGWIVMVVVVMATFAITMVALGLENILQPDSYWTTDTFNIIVLAGGFVAAIAGGVVCKAIARSSNATYALVTIVLAMGIVSAISNMNKADPPARTGDPTIEDMMMHGKEPNWFAITKVVLAVGGLIIGSAMISSRKSATR